jgi:pSer/pThr/pTyr-binding forkhead associated (FHA) protein
MLHEPSNVVEVTKNESIIGRSSQCDIKLKQVEVSGKHCRIFRLNRGGNENEFDVFIEDFR